MNRFLSALLLVSAAILSPASGALSEEQAANEVRLTDNQMKLIELKTTTAEAGMVGSDFIVNGEITANQDQALDILPRAAGIVREVKGRLGETVVAGATLAVIESGEAAGAETTYLAARSKAGLARAQAVREEGLWRKGISSQQDYQVARQSAEEAGIQLRAAERQLRLLGLDPSDADATLGSATAPVRLTVSAPSAGTLIERRVAVGDQVTSASPLFRLANLDTVWVIASVFEKDIGRTAPGQIAKITFPQPGREFEGRVTWVSDVLDEKTRTLRIRIELSNRDRFLKPGSFVRVSSGAGRSARGPRDTGDGSSVAEGSASRLRGRRGRPLQAPPRDPWRPLARQGRRDRWPETGRTYRHQWRLCLALRAR